MNSAMQNLIIGTEQLAKERQLAEAEKLQAKQQELAQQQAGATEPVQEMTQAELSEAVQTLSKIMLELTNKVDGGAK